MSSQTKGGKDMKKLQALSGSVFQQNRAGSRQVFNTILTQNCSNGNGVKRIVLPEFLSRRLEVLQTELNSLRQQSHNAESSTTGAVKISRELAICIAALGQIQEDRDSFQVPNYTHRDLQHSGLPVSESQPQSSQLNVQVSQPYSQVTQSDIQMFQLDISLSNVQKGQTNEQTEQLDEQEHHISVLEDQLGVQEDQSDVQEDQSDVQEDQSDVQEDQSDVQEDQSDVQEDQSDVQEDQSDVQEDQSDVQEDQSDVQEDQSDVQEDQSDVQEDQSDVQAILLLVHFAMENKGMRDLFAGLTELLVAILPDVTLQLTVKVLNAACRFVEMLCYHNAADGICKVCHRFAMDMQKLYVECQLIAMEIKEISESYDDVLLQLDTMLLNFSSLSTELRLDYFAAASRNLQMLNCHSWATENMQRKQFIVLLSTWPARESTDIGNCGLTPLHYAVMQGDYATCHLEDAVSHKLKATEEEHLQWLKGIAGSIIDRLLSLIVPEDSGSSLFVPTNWKGNRNYSVAYSQFLRMLPGIDERLNPRLFEKILTEIQDAKAESKVKERIVLGMKFVKYSGDGLNGPNWSEFEERNSNPPQKQRAVHNIDDCIIIPKEGKKATVPLGNLRYLIKHFEQLFGKVDDENVDTLAVDSKYKRAYAAVRVAFANIRRNLDSWQDKVLHSAVGMFSEGAFNSSVRQLMNRNVARFGRGGNGELVEAFQSGQRLIIKKTLLRESEWSIATQMSHPNVMPLLALICGDRSDTRPGQVVSYQVMPKMTEDFAASIRKMGGSIHHYILLLQETEEPNHVLSSRADLVRQRSAEVLRAVLQGLDYMHRQNVVHRDIKASNILLRRPEDCPHEAVHTCTCPGQWEVKVADFDSVIHLNVARDRARRRKQLKVGNTGTSGYRAPEVFNESCTSDIDDPEYYSPASDIWSFGGVCLHLAMGFCCPRMQYQVSLMRLAHHGIVNIPAAEAQEKVDRTIGTYHIRQGFTGEKWLNMINFTARPLEVDPMKRPTAAVLLKDTFLEPVAADSSTDNDTKGDTNLQTAKTSISHKKKDAGHSLR